MTARRPDPYDLALDAFNERAPEDFPAQIGFATPAEEAAWYDEQMGLVRAKIHKLHHRIAAGTSRESRELVLELSTLRKLKAEALASAPPEADLDPEAQREAILAYVRGLPADDPLRTKLRAVLDQRPQQAPPPPPRPPDPDEDVFA